MSVLPLKADIRQREWHVRHVPEADVLGEAMSVLSWRDTSGTCADVVAFCGCSVLEKKAISMASSKEKPLDNPTFEACQEALVAALATVQQWRPGGEVDPQLKAKLALLIIKHAAKGETSPAILRKRALANYFLESACEESGS